MPYLHWGSYDTHESRTAATHTKQDYCPLNASSEIKLIYHYFYPESSVKNCMVPRIFTLEEVSINLTISNLGTLMTETKIKYSPGIFRTRRRRQRL
jgi:hypothetical protein